MRNTTGATCDTGFHRISFFTCCHGFASLFPTNEFECSLVSFASLLVIVFTMSRAKQRGFVRLHNADVIN